MYLEYSEIIQSLKINFSQLSNGFPIVLTQAEIELFHFKLGQLIHADKLTFDSC